jgi:hypothetical protein
MPLKINWTEPDDDILRECRAAGASWSDISLLLGVTPNAAAERGRTLRARIAPRPPPGPPPPPAHMRNPGRESLPAGHPVTWNLLTEGTSAANTPYPKGQI